MNQELVVGHNRLRSIIHQVLKKQHPHSAVLPVRYKQTVSERSQTGLNKASNKTEYRKRTYNARNRRIVERFVY